MISCEIERGASECAELGNNGKINEKSKMLRSRVEVFIIKKSIGQ
jgi:hypothetical protein